MCLPDGSQIIAGPMARRLLLSGSNTEGGEREWDVVGPLVNIALELDGTWYCVVNSEAYTITVNPLPSPSVSDPGQVCPNALGINYNTALEAGHSYFWDVTGESGFTGQGTNSINVDWSVGPAGEVIVFDTITATGCGYSDTVIVSILDVTDPVITCPADVVQGVDADQCYGTVIGIAPASVTDDCPGAPTVTYILSNATTGSGADDASGTQFAVGITQLSGILQRISVVIKTHVASQLPLMMTRHLCLHVRQIRRVTPMQVNAHTLAQEENLIWIMLMTTAI